MAAKKKPAKPATKATPKKGERTRDWAPAFLKALTRAANVAEACKAAGIGRDTYYRRRKSDAVFFQAAREAVTTAVEDLERVTWNRALDGWDEPVIHKGELCMQWVDATGKPVERGTPGARMVPLTIRKFNATLAIFLLKAHRPKKYREHHQVEHSGKIKHQECKAEDLTDEELADIIRADDARSGRQGNAAPQGRQVKSP